MSAPFKISDFLDCIVPRKSATAELALYSQADALLERAVAGSASMLAGIPTVTPDRLAELVDAAVAEALAQIAGAEALLRRPDFPNAAWRLTLPKEIQSRKRFFAKRPEVPCWPHIELVGIEVREMLTSALKPVRYASADLTLTVDEPHLQAVHFLGEGLVRNSDFAVAGKRSIPDYFDKGRAFETLELRATDRWTLGTPAANPFHTKNSRSALRFVVAPSGSSPLVAFDRLAQLRHALTRPNPPFSPAEPEPREFGIVSDDESILDMASRQGYWAFGF